jgi:hypothetical protein
MNVNPFLPIPGTSGKLYGNLDPLGHQRPHLAIQKCIKERSWLCYSAESNFDLQLEWR